MVRIDVVPVPTKLSVSGNWLETHIMSGSLTVTTTTDVSGQPVTISGNHVFVESGVYLASGIWVQGAFTAQVSGQPVAISGSPVTISGDHVFVESGVYIASGVGVLVSGQFTDRSGLGVSISGQMVQVASGVYTIGGFTSGSYGASGIGVVVQSGFGVLISGQHVYVESGVYLASGVIVNGLTFAGGGQDDALEVVVTGFGQDSLLGDSLAFPCVIVSGNPASLSGLATRSGVGVIINSGVGVTVQSGVYLASGIFVVAVAASGTYGASGVGVLIQSGAGVLISGQHVYVESGVYIASGLGVLISGQHVYVESGVYIASGLFDAAMVSGEMINGPVGSGVLENVMLYGWDNDNNRFDALQTNGGGELYVTGQVGVYLISGLYGASGLGVVIQSGAGVLISGQHVYVESGVYIASGLFVTADIAESGIGVQTQSGVFVASGIGVVIQSGVILTSGIFFASGIGVFNRTQVSGGVIVSGAVQVSGAVAVSGIVGVSGSISVHSGLVGITSGRVDVLSGQIHILSGEVTVYTPPVIWTNVMSGNPAQFTDASGGQTFASGAIISVILKAHNQNSGDVYIGGISGGHRPFSGAGFLLTPGEAINLDIPQMGYITACATMSGDRVSYIGIL